MKTKTTYWITYLASIIVPLVVGFLTSRWGLVILLSYVLGLAINIWYATTLGISTGKKIACGIFGVIGFEYLMGYHRDTISGWELTKQTFTFYGRVFRPLFLTALGTGLAISILSGLFVALVSFTTFIPQTALRIIAGAILILLFFLCIIVFGIWGGIILYHIIDANIQEKGVTLKEAVKKSVRLIGKTLGAGILQFCIVSLPLFAFSFFLILYVRMQGAILTFQDGIQPFFANILSYVTLPAILLLIGILYGIIHNIYFSIRLIFAPFGVIFDGQSIYESVQRSFMLTKSRWWIVNWRLLIPFTIILLAIYLSLGVLLILLDIFVNDPDLVSILQQFFTLIIQVFFLPLFPITMVLLYRNLKK